MRLEKLSLGDVANELTVPFSMVGVAHVEDLEVSMYLCHGTLAWHRHLDQDELFWVHQGSILLDTELGHLKLNKAELAVVRKGLNHRSSASSPATVILVRCFSLPDRKNGRLRLYGTRDVEPKHVDLSAAGNRLEHQYSSQAVARVENAVVRVVRGKGVWPKPEPPSFETMLVVLSGSAVVHVAEESLEMEEDDLTVVPRNVGYHVTSTTDAVLVLMSRDEREQ